MSKIYFCDGGCRPTNPGPGGYGWIEVDGSTISAYDSEYFDETTNNRMELLAMLSVLKHVDKNYPNESVTIYSDSAYVVRICTEWMRGWAANGWVRTKGQPIENLEIIKEIYKYYNKNFWNLSIEKCKGHSGNTFNEIVDALTWSVDKFKVSAQKYGIEIIY